MSAIINASPMANLLGIEDRSGRAPVYDPETVPSHLPHIYLFAEKGPSLPQLVGGDAFRELYGAKTLDSRSPYYNHQSVLAGEMLGEANSMIVQRIIPADAGPKARLLLSVDIIEDAVPQFQRGTDGSFTLDVNGAKIPVAGGGATLPGHKLKWVLNNWAGTVDDDEFGEVTNKVGTLTNAVPETSTLYPILEFEVNFQGAYGNNQGLRLVVPTTRSASQLNDTVAEAVKAFLYRIMLVRRDDANSSPILLDNMFGEKSIDFTFKENAVNTFIDTELSFEDIFIDAYQDIESPGVPPKYGPFGRVHVYRSNLEMILEMVGAVEAPQDTLTTATIDSDSENLHEVNIFTGVNYQGIPYYTLNVLGPANGGILFGENTTLYAAGGSDGTMTNAAFDLAVRSELTNYGDAEADLLDWAQYPQSCIYDTGFALDTKFAMISVIGRRKDIWVGVSTQDITQPQNTAAEESSIAISLRAAARNYPEAELFGTPVCRAVIIGHSGHLINSKYKGLLPLTIEFAKKCARFMGAGNGNWSTGLGFDMPPNNQITMFRDVNVTFKPASVRNQDWATGLVWAQRYDRKSLFWPAVQTVYDDDSSVLNSAITMMACVELQKVCQRAWRDLTGISKLTADQFIERSDRLITAQTQRARFDDRFVIQPETYYTAADEQRGYSWSCKVNIYAPNMKTVGTYTVVAHRISDLNAAP